MPSGVFIYLGNLGVPTPFSCGRIRNVDHLAFREAMLARYMSVWGGLHIRLVVLPPGPKLGTYLW